MFFSINYNNSLNFSIIKKKLLNIAKTRIVLYKTTTNEIKLNEYLIENYGKSLKTTCLNLLFNSYISKTDKKITIRFKTNEENKIASLITYGNEKLAGSKILQNAFK